MATTRPFIRWFLAVVLAAFAVPALAQNVKYFTLAEIIAPATIGNPSSWSPPAASPTVATTVTQVTIAYTNIANGNSNFSSFSVTGTGSGGASVKILSATSSRGGTPSQSATNSYTFTDTGPVKRNETAFMTLTVELKTTGCSNGQILWSGTAWTGSVSNPSTNFQQQNVPGPTMTVSAGCTYSYTITDKILKGDKDKELTATVSNPSSSPADINSITLTPPSGITASVSSTSGFPISPGGTPGTVLLNASAPCDSTSSGGDWTTQVTGFTTTEQATSVVGLCKLQFSAYPTSIIPTTSYELKLRLYNNSTGNPTISGYTGNVTISTATTGCTIVGTTTVAAVSGVATFNVSLGVDADVTLCTIKGKTTIGSTDFNAADVDLKVFDGILGCASGTVDSLSLPTSGEGTFDASQGGDALGETGFVFGVRAYDPEKGVCPTSTKLNYAVVNNIPSTNTSDQTDPLNNTVPPGFYSLTWDANQLDTSGNLLRPIIAVVATYRSEWGDATTGLPTHKTLICTATPCNAAPYVSGVVNTAGGWKPAVACLSSLVLHSSIPTGEPGCLVSERWDLVNVGDADYCTGTGPGATPRCLKPTSIMLMGQDPIWGR